MERLRKVVTIHIFCQQGIKNQPLATKINLNSAKFCHQNLLVKIVTKNIKKSLVYGDIIKNVK
jgi:hypothetical protein